VLILPPSHALAQTETIDRDDLYKLQFISLDAQSTIRKVIDQVLSRHSIETTRLKVEMELNSIEAIKNAVQSGLGAAFVSVSAIEKELKHGLLHRARIQDVVVRRALLVIYNPNRYRSKAAEAFSREILPCFASHSNFVNTLDSLQRNGKGNSIPTLPTTVLTDEPLLGSELLEDSRKED
jgi:DNA-binding transcriptional LysR family regulator